MKYKLNEILLGEGYVAPASKVVELLSEGVLCGSGDNPTTIYDWVEDDPDNDLVF